MPTNICEKKKQSPSTQKRSPLRKKAFLEKKAEEKITKQQTLKISSEHTEITIKCNQCEVAFISKDAQDMYKTGKHFAPVICQRM